MPQKLAVAFDDTSISHPCRQGIFGPVKRFEAL